MAERRVKLGQSKNGIQTWFNPHDSHAATHIEDTPVLKDLVVEILTDTILDRELVEFDKNMGRVVGESDLVDNDKDDEIIYAKRLNRDAYTPFNKTKPPVPSSEVSVSFKRQPDGTYELQSAWIGPIDSPPFPGDPNETPESKSYWTTHSLAWGKQKIQAGSETRICPW